VAAPERSRRADILAAAEREFGLAGFSGGRIERIAAQARVNKQLLFHYFESKEGLFSAALPGLLSQLEPPAATGNPAELREALQQLEVAAHRHPGLVAIVADANANPDFPGGALLQVRAWQSRTRARIEAAVAEGQRPGHFRDDIDPGAVARMAMAAALGAAALEKSAAAPAVEVVVLDYCAWR